MNLDDMWTRAAPDAAEAQITEPEPTFVLLDFPLWIFEEDQEAAS